MDSIEKGIVELISRYRIRKLVMGAAADKHYSRKMMEPKSKKAIYVHQQAPVFSHIWFICKGHLVHTREGNSEGSSSLAASPKWQPSTNSETGQSSSLSSYSLQEVEVVRQQVAEAKKELRMAQEQKLSLETRIARTEKMVQGLEQKMFSALELLQRNKSEREELQVELDNAPRVTEELRKKQTEEVSNALGPQCYSEFSFSEIEEATGNFDPSKKIGKGGYGSIYKGLLRHTQVAIKRLDPNSSQGPSEFQQEVNILSKLRHPNLITLVGACPEAWILVYEYLPNGSLEDRLSCRDNTPPLSWQTRIRIAAELCSVLVFLHSCDPHKVVHGDLKPANILLDANYTCKLSDFGICRVITRNDFSNSNATLCCRTDPKGTFAYMDPEFFSTGELTPKSDVYSFGIILLRLLTGRPALGITKEVQYALDKGNLKDLLDPAAGDWPFVQAKQLAHLAMSCCEVNRRSRPDLASEVYRVLEPMKVSCGVSSFRMSSE